MSAWTQERVLGLAPDAASAKAGQGLAQPRHWAEAAGDSAVLWGSCQGSGSKPYQVRIDLAEPAFKCSCPSRKFPCKHALGLLLQFAAGVVPVVTAADRPAWVEQWLAERAVHADKKQEKLDAPPKPADVGAKQARRDQRLDRIADGLSTLRLWINDLVRDGLATAPSRGYAFFDQPARRLVDAQAPGVARRVRDLAGIAAGGAGWQRSFLRELAALHLFVRGFERREKLPKPALDTLLNTAGISRTKEIVLSGPRIEDRWQVLAQEFGTDDKLRFRRTWVLGERTGRALLVLDFAHDATPFDASPLAGFSFAGELCPYPGDAARAIFRTAGTPAPLTGVLPTLSLDELANRYADGRALDPWFEGFVAAARAVVPTPAGGGCMLVDSTGRALPATIRSAEQWTLLAISGGGPLDVIGHFDGERLRPLACIADGRYIRLARATGGDA